MTIYTPNYEKDNMNFAVKLFYFIVQNLKKFRV